MDAPLCRLCNRRHYSHEPHIWASRDFVVIEEAAAVTPAMIEAVSKMPPVPVGVGGVVEVCLAERHEGSLFAIAGSTATRENKSRYRSAESAEAYRAYMRDYMARKRAIKD